MQNSFYVLDIETIVDGSEVVQNYIQHRRAQLIPPFLPTEIITKEGIQGFLDDWKKSNVGAVELQVPGNLKNIEPIQRWYTDQRRNGERKFMSKICFDPDLIRPICVYAYKPFDKSWVVYFDEGIVNYINEVIDREEPVTIRAFRHYPETFEIVPTLEDFLLKLMAFNVITFNGYSFDLPVLQRAAAKEGASPEVLNSNMFQQSKDWDLFYLLTQFRGHHHEYSKSLYNYAKIYLPDFSPPDLPDGKDTATMYGKGDHATYCNMCEADVMATWEIAHKLFGDRYDF